MDCGPTCLRIIAKYYGKSYTLQTLREMCHTTREGSSLLDISDAAEKIGFNTLGVKVEFDKLEDEVPLPCIAHWNDNHFVVIYKVKKDTVYISDPAHGLLQYNKQEFLKCWSANSTQGILLLLQPTPEFYNDSESADSNKKEARGFAFLFKYLFRYKKFLVQLLIGLLAGSLLQLILPFLTQSVVDVGIQYRDIDFIYLMLFAQLMLFFGRTSIDIIRTWILMHISSRINISLVSDFFVKLMKLPIAFFDVKMTGDIMQRIGDHTRIETFLTSTSLNVLFSMFNLLVFGGVLAYYNMMLFIVFMLGSIIYLLWITFFLRYRADLDYKRFTQMSKNQSKIMELISGMQEIKMHNAEKQKRWAWEHLQVQMFKIDLKGLTLEQTQQVGSSLINELKNMFITILAAKLVIDGQITLGMMLSISYITGQLNGPIMQLVSFVQNYQDAKISLERLSEIHSKEDEEKVGDEKIYDIPADSSIVLKNVSFQYSGPNSEMVLKNLSLTIPANKITAIVGSSGSGKTTLMKMLMKFYAPVSGEIAIGNYNMVNVSERGWRSRCGVVMQEGYIFSDTIANNIAVGVDSIDKARLVKAATIANIKDTIEGMPLGYNTKIGSEGMGISTGQKQRILIARAVYKNPEYLFFDEATSALDANNEKIIVDNLAEFFNGKTVVVIAHRLSTVKNADQIVVLEEGKIAEIGTHKDLVAKKGFYYNLVKNQLELGD